VRISSRPRVEAGIIGTGGVVTKKDEAAAAKVASRLARAQAEGLLVRVRRTLPDADVLDGFVVDVGPQWLALARLSDRIELDGWSLLRLADVRSVKLEPDADCFEVRALRARGQWPPAAPGVPLDDTAAAVLAAGAAHPLVAVHRELDRPDVAWVGAVRGVRGATLFLLEVGVQADWSRKPRAYDLDDITRVDFGGGYEEALALVAGKAPDA
jgi:hypothetical protein